MEELAEHIIDLARNSVEAGATSIVITVKEDPDQDILSFSIVDNGCGIEPDKISHVTNPFFTGRDKPVGLGVSLLQAAVEICGGDLKISSNSSGTRVEAVFPYHHIDRAPLGKVSEAISVILASANNIELTYYHYYKDQEFTFTTSEVTGLLDGVPLQTPAVLAWVEEFMEREIKNMKEAN